MLFLLWLGGFGTLRVTRIWYGSLFFIYIYFFPLRTFKPSCNSLAAAFSLKTEYWHRCLFFPFSFVSLIRFQWYSTRTMCIPSRLWSPTVMSTSHRGIPHLTYRQTWIPKQVRPQLFCSFSFYFSILQMFMVKVQNLKHSALQKYLLHFMFVTHDHKHCVEIWFYVKRQHKVGQNQKTLEELQVRGSVNTIQHVTFRPTHAERCI